jgi:hypothetical protein
LTSLSGASFIGTSIARKEPLSLGGPTSATGTNLALDGDTPVLAARLITRGNVFCAS